MNVTRTAARLPVHRGPAGWTKLLSEPRSARPLTGQHTADFAIIGGGIAGTAAARRLSQLNPGARIALLEAHRICDGAAGRNSGFMIDLPHELSSEDYAGGAKDAQLIKLNRHAIAFAKEAVIECDIPHGYFEQIGKVNGAVSEAADRQNASYAKHLDSLGERWERLDSQAMFELTGSRYYRSGLYTPGTVLVQPAGYIRGLAAGLWDRVKIYENSPVLGFESTGADWTIATPKGQLTAAKIILATNGHLESFGYMQRRLMHLFLYGSMTEELSDTALAKLGGAPHWGVTPSNPMGTTMRRITTAQGGNRIITRTCATLNQDMESKTGQYDRAAAVMRRKFTDRFPDLAGVKMQYVWAGHLCLSRNGVSVMREIERNVFTACAQNGLGLSRGTLTGIGAAELASGQTSPVTELFAEDEDPLKMPPEPFASLGANVYLRAKEFEARRE